MERVIVSISRPDQGELDLEVPVDLPVGVLVQELALALGWDARGELYADPPGRKLSPSETLAQAGIWDGARLLFQGPGSAGSTPPPPPPPPPPAGEGPLRGWQPLDLGQAPTSSAPQTSGTTSPFPSGGFVWKRVDED